MFPGVTKLLAKKETVWSRMSASSGTGAESEFTYIATQKLLGSDPEQTLNSMVENSTDLSK